VNLHFDEVSTNSSNGRFKISSIYMEYFPVEDASDLNFAHAI
jgi:hypothetical protein